MNKDIIIAAAADLNMKKDLFFSRRDFLKTAGAAVIGATLLACRDTSTGYIAPAQEPTDLPTSTVEPFGVNEYEFISQSEIEEKLKGPFDYFKGDENIKELFENPDSIIYTAGGIKVYDAFGNPTAYTFFSATSEDEKRSFVAMVFGGENSEVSYAVLNRVLSEKNTVGLGLTYDPTTDSELLRPVLIFDTNLTEEQIQELTPEQLASIDLIFIPGGVVVPNDKIYGIKNAVLVPVESQLPAEVQKKFEGTNFKLNTDGTVTYNKEGEEQVKVDGLKINNDGSIVVEYKGQNPDYIGKTYNIKSAEFTKNLSAKNGNLSFTDNDGVIWTYDSTKNILLPEITRNMELPDEFPDIDLDYALTNPEFDNKILNLQKRGRFIESTGEEIPLQPGDLVVNYNSRLAKTDGFELSFEINDEADDKFDSKNNIPVQIVAIYDFKTPDGLEGNLLIERWTDTSGDFKFRKVIEPKRTTPDIPKQLLALSTELGYNTNMRFPSGRLIFNDHGLNLYTSRNSLSQPQAFIDMYTKHRDLFEKYHYVYEQLNRTGIFDNSKGIPIVIANGLNIQ